jgi:hypothetical protein
VRRVMHRFLVLIGLRYVEGESVRLTEASWRLRLTWVATLIAVGFLMGVAQRWGQSISW